MIFWVILALMTGAAIFAVIWPLARSRRAAPSGSEVEVYRDQLDELERDLAAGSIGRTEAEAARVEDIQALLAAVDAAESSIYHCSVDLNGIVSARNRSGRVARAPRWGGQSLSSPGLAGACI